MSKEGKIHPPNDILFAGDIKEEDESKEEDNDEEEEKDMNENNPNDEKKLEEEEEKEIQKNNENLDDNEEIIDTKNKNIEDKQRDNKKNFNDKVNILKENLQNHEMLKKEDEEEENKNKVYLLNIEENGLPKIQKNEIYSMNINSELNLKLFNGIKISNEISLITNSLNEFPSPFFLDELLETQKNVKKEEDINSIEDEEDEKNNNDEFPLDKIMEYQIKPNEINTEIIFKINLNRAGLISFVFLYKDEATNSFLLTKPFNILVNPLIELNKKNIPINKIQLQTVLSKNLGNLSNFDDYFKEVSLLKYNFIHFTTFL